MKNFRFRVIALVTLTLACSSLLHARQFRQILPIATPNKSVSSLPEGAIAVEKTQQLDRGTVAEGGNAFQYFLRHAPGGRQQGNGRGAARVRPGEGENQYCVGPDGGPAPLAACQIAANGNKPAGAVEDNRDQEFPALVVIPTAEYNFRWPLVPNPNIARCVALLGRVRLAPFRSARA